MIYNIIIVIISLILDIIFNLLLKSNSYLLPLFTLISLINIYPYFKNSKKDYLIFSLIVGFIYDLFNNYFFILNPIIFFIISDFIYNYFRRFNYNLIFNILLSFLIIIIYELLMLLIYNLTNYQIYTINEFLYIFPHFFISNILYIIIIYFSREKIIRID